MSSQTPALTRRNPWSLYAAAALLFIAVGAGAFFFFTRPPQDPLREDALRKTTDPRASAISDTGRLLIDARPWGELLRLVDSEGQEIDIASDLQTPVALELTPGHYTAFLSHPDLAGESQLCDVEVQLGTDASCRLDLVEITTDNYWEEMRWWR